ncbi:MAG: PAS domain S-box protein [Nitrospiraceae bacterium]
MANHADQETGRRALLLRLLVENVQNYAVFIMDPEGRIETWNPGAERLLGYQPGEIIGRPFSTIFLAEEVQQSVPEQELKQAAETGQASDDRWAVRKDGSRLRVSGVTIALRDSTLHGFGKIMRDHTQWMQAQEQIQRLNEDLKQKVQDYEHAVGDLRTSQKSLQDTVSELERFAEVVVGRELKMSALEKEVDRLRKELDRQE